MILLGGSVLLGTFGLYVLLYCLIFTLSSLTLNASVALRRRCRFSGCTFQFISWDHHFYRDRGAPKVRGP